MSNANTRAISPIFFTGSEQDKLSADDLLKWEMRGEQFEV